EPSLSSNVRSERPEYHEASLFNEASNNDGGITVIYKQISNQIQMLLSRPISKSTKTLSELLVENGGEIKEPQ
ncbi:unnamed protein product, partial [Rotaria sp. Silwood1]